MTEVAPSFHSPFSIKRSRAATMPRQIRRMTQLHAPGAIEISVKSKTATASNVTQR